MTRRRVSLRVGVLASAALFAFAVPALATSRSLPRLTDVTADEEGVSFRQPDGTYTVIDLASGAVAARGGTPPEGWLPPPVCEVDASPCAFPGGVVALKMDSTGARLEGRTASKSWSVDMTGRMPSTSQRVWAAGERLLIESPSFETATLECLDIASGRSLWVYFYPSPWSGPRFPVTSTTAARSARVRMDEDATRWRSFGGDPSPQIVLDPDPLQTRATARWLAAGWAWLLAVLAAAFLLLREGASGGLAVVLVAASAGLLVRFVTVDARLALALSIGFLVVAARGLSAARGPSRFAVQAVVVVTVTLLALSVVWPSMIR